MNYISLALCAYLDVGGDFRDASGCRLFACGFGERSRTATSRTEIVGVQRNRLLGHLRSYVVRAPPSPSTAVSHVRHALDCLNRDKRMTTTNNLPAPGTASLHAAPTLSLCYPGPASLVREGTRFWCPIPGVRPRRAQCAISSSSILSIPLPRPSQTQPLAPCFAADGVRPRRCLSPHAAVLSGTSSILSSRFMLIAGQTAEQALLVNFSPDPPRLSLLQALNSPSLTS
ncbi:hypothetical protein LIA77_06593 [Sarocladium implicatum]|nr:hypothetical protein LIA77_06593 [Sarocladium implicatum]